MYMYIGHRYWPMDLMNAECGKDRAASILFSYDVSGVSEQVIIIIQSSRRIITICAHSQSLLKRRSIYNVVGVADDEAKRKRITSRMSL